MTIFGDKIFKEGIKVKLGYLRGYNPIGSVSLIEEEIWTHKKTPGTHVYSYV